MNVTRADRSTLKEMFQTRYTLPFSLLLILLVFNSFRPDRLMPGGSFLLYFPTAILFVLLILWLRTPRKILSNPQTKLFFAFVVLMALDVPLARNPSRAFAQFTSILLYALIPYVVMVQFVDTSSKVEKYIRLFLILSLYFGFLGIIKKAKIALPVLADENDFALFMNILIPVGFFLGQEATTLKKKMFYYSTLIIFVLANVSSFSRGGLTGLVAVGLFLFYKSRRKLFSLLLFVFLIACIFSFAPQRYWDKIDTIWTQGAQEGTGRERIESWKAGWRMFLDNPILGVGPKNFGMWLPDYYIQYASKRPANMWGRVAHSLYFTLIPETGIVGTLLFAAMVWKNYKNYAYIVGLEKRKEGLFKKYLLDEKTADLVRLEIRKLNYLSLGYWGALIAFMTTGAFISVLWYGYFWMLTSFFVMTANAARKIEDTLIEKSLMKEGQDQTATNMRLALGGDSVR